MPAETYDYRQKYRNYYHIEFDRDMEVHHIDFDRSNDCIENLILLPRKLHHRYHGTMKALCGTESSIISGDFALRFDLNIESKVRSFRCIATILEESEPWIELKYRLDDYARCGPYGNPAWLEYHLRKAIGKLPPDIPCEMHNDILYIGSNAIMKRGQ
jgi:hypothetical protein